MLRLFLIVLPRIVPLCDGIDTTIQIRPPLNQLFSFHNKLILFFSNYSPIYFCCPIDSLLVKSITLFVVYETFLPRTKQTLHFLPIVRTVTSLTFLMSLSLLPLYPSRHLPLKKNFVYFPRGVWTLLVKVPKIVCHYISWNTKFLS